MRLAAIIASGFGFIGLPFGALACSCAVDRLPLTKQVEAAVGGSDVVAEVQIISTSIIVVRREVSGQRWNWDDRRYHDYVEVVSEPKLVARLNVVRYWKGGDHGLVAVSTAVEWQACGLGFEAGQHLLLYARTAPGGETMESDSCTRTKLVEKARREIQLLDRLRAEQPSNNVFKVTRETRAP
jgi:hypothetical protein